MPHGRDLRERGDCSANLKVTRISEQRVDSCTHRFSGTAAFGLGQLGCIFQGAESEEETRIEMSDGGTVPHRLGLPCNAASRGRAYA